MRDAPDYETLVRGFRWNVPETFNIAWACCGRHALQRDKFALYFEDEDGTRGAYSFWDVQVRANRLSNALRALGIEAGERVALILPQRPETAIAYMAIFQMGAIAVPLSHLFGPDALEHRLRDAGVAAAIVDAQSLPRLWAIRERLPGLRRVVGVAGAREAGVEAWDDLLERASPRFEAAATAANDPALIIYTSGTTGASKGALIPHRALIGNLPGFACSHDFFPMQGDMFWSPADWAWTGGLFDALLPTWYFGMPILAYRGRFDPERAFTLIERYGVRNAFIFPTGLKMMMKEVAHPNQRFDIGLRSLMSGGEAVGDAVSDWARHELGVRINEIFGQTEMNYLIGGCSALFDPRPGAMGRPYPGHRIRLIDEHGAEVPAGEMGEIAVWREGDPVVFLEYWNNPQATRDKFLAGWGRTGDLAVRDEHDFLWYKGRTDDVIKSAGYRIGPSEIEDCLVKHPAVMNAAVVGVPDTERGALIKAFIVLRAGFERSTQVEQSIRQHVRERLAPYQYPKLIDFVDELPLTTTGKVQRRILREAPPPPS
ncbi:MAG: AMP-binding protein [Burkholderiales bacterium]|nr:AMP-binding protein [Burkholderiales bacterium]